MPAFRIALWVSSAGCLALLAKSLLVGPPPLWVALTALGLYLLLVGVGLAFPRVEMFGEVLTRGRPGEGRMALTFQGAFPGPAVARIARILQRGRHTGTFFVAEADVSMQASLIAELWRNGHTIGILYPPPRRPLAFRSPARMVRDLHRAKQSIAHACGEDPRFLRPANNRVGPRLARAARLADLDIVGHTFSAMNLRAEQAVRRVLCRLSNGAIVRLRDDAVTVEALPVIMAELRRRGLTAVSLDELCRD